MDTVEVVFDRLLPLSLVVVFSVETVVSLFDFVGSGFLLLFLSLVEVVFVVDISLTLAQFGCMGSLVTESY